MFFDRANLDRSQPVGHVNIRVSGVCPVYGNAKCNRRRVSGIMKDPHSFAESESFGKTNEIRGVLAARCTPSYARCRGSHATRPPSIRTILSGETVKILQQAISVPSNWRLNPVSEESSSGRLNSSHSGSSTARKQLKKFSSTWASGYGKHEFFAIVTKTMGSP